MSEAASSPPSPIKRIIRWWLARRRARARRQRRQDRLDLIFRPEPSNREQYIEGLQKDAIVLMRYVVGRPDRPLTQPGRTDPTGVSELVFMPAKQMSMHHVDNLQDLLDQLSRLAAPATASSIRLTHAYLHNPPVDGEPPGVIRRQAGKLRWRIHQIRFVAAALFVFTVVVLVHATSGRQALEQLEQQQNVLTVLEDRLALAPAQADAGASSAARDDCSQPKQDEARSMSARHQTCSRRDTVMREQADTRRLLERWNCRSARAFGQLPPWQSCQPGEASPTSKPAAQPSPEPTLATTTAPPGPNVVSLAKGVDNSARIIAGNFLSTLNSFILPMLVGALGGCVYVLRRFDSKIREMTLLASEISHAWFRILLAAIMGSLLGVVWDGGSKIQVQGFSFSIVAIAFFVGFSLEIVFSVIETMVGSIAGRLNASPGAVPSAPYLMPISGRTKDGGPGQGGTPDTDRK